MVKTIRVVGGVFYRRHLEPEIQIFRRMRGSHAGFYEFPGGKIEESDGSPEGALARELREELGVEVQVQDFIGTTAFEMGDTLVELNLYFVVAGLGSHLALKEHDQWMWIDSNFRQMEIISKGDQNLLGQIFTKLKTKI